MLNRRALLAGALALVCLAPAQALARSGKSPSSALVTNPTAGEPTDKGSLPQVLRSRELWATIDVCDPSDQPDTVGIRGSMPGDKHPHDRLWMSFHLQYLLSGTTTWTDLATSAATTEYMYVGAGKTPAREDGTSFVIKPVQGKPAVTLRGVVYFQWRRNGTVLETVTETTTPGHRSLAGADPAGYSAATCQIG